MYPTTTARIAGSALCDWGYSRDPGNPGCELVALPGFDLCPSHHRIMAYLEAQAAQQPMSVRIDVSEEDGLLDEAVAAGCAAVKVTDPNHLPHWVCVYVVNGPEVAVLGLLKQWGYDEGCYEVLGGCPFCGSTDGPCHTADGRIAQRPHAHKVPLTPGWTEDDRIARMGPA